MHMGINILWDSTQAIIIQALHISTHFLFESLQYTLRLKQLAKEINFGSSAIGRPFLLQLHTFF